jgi:hypothetical protein
MQAFQRVVLSLGAASLLLSGCGKIAAIEKPVVKSGTADFSVYAAMGTSISAGEQSAGLVDRHQVKSFPYLFSQQVGVSQFTFPSINNDGIPPLLRVQSLSPLIISNAGGVLGNPIYIAQPAPYHDMGIPFAILDDVTSELFYYNKTVHPESVYFWLIARHLGTVLKQVTDLAPTFVTIEYGSNEALGPATRGGATPLYPGAAWAAKLTATLNAVDAALPNAKKAIFNVPDVVSVPNVTTFPPYVLDATGSPVIIGGAPLTLLGLENGAVSATPIAPNDFVVLAAGDSLAVGTGFPVGTYSYITLPGNVHAPGNGRPLPNSMVLNATEAANIEAAVTAYNTAIATEAKTRGYALVDINAILRQAANGGISYQGSLYTADFITGGLFSLDGVHPNDLGQGLFCNALIEAVNSKFGSTIPLLNLSSVASATSSRARPYGVRAFPWLQGASQSTMGIFPWRQGGTM